MPPRPHGHGDDEEEDLGPRVDGPPFFDVVSKQGQGFDVDFDKLQKSLGPGKISLGDFMRDVEAINRVYVPIVQRSYKWMRYGSMSMLGGLVMFIIMGIIGGTPEIRSVMILLSLLAFLGGLGSFLYSKWIEQGIIKEGARAVKMVIDEELNPKYLDNPHRLKYTVAVLERELKTLHLGRTLLERPVVTLWCLYSPNAEGAMTEWDLPDAIVRADSITIRHSRSSIIGTKGKH